MLPRGKTEGRMGIAELVKNGQGETCFSEMESRGRARDQGPIGVIGPPRSKQKFMNLIYMRRSLM